MQDVEMVTMSFYITSIENGWLFADLELGEQKIQLANSCLGGLELPKALIKVCNAVLLDNAADQWLCWHGESCAHIWHLQRDVDHLSMKTYSLDSSFGLPVCGESMAQKIQWLTPELTVSIDRYVFAQTIYHAFKSCRFGDMLAQWESSEFKNYFPEEEYHTLRKLLRSAGFQ